MRVLEYLVDWVSGCKANLVYGLLYISRALFVYCFMLLLSDHTVLPLATTSCSLFSKNSLAFSIFLVFVLSKILRYTCIK